MIRFVVLFIALITQARAIEFPATPPGPASGRSEENAWVLENQVLSARYLVQDNTLKLDQISRSGPASFIGGADLFVIRFTNGSTLGSSAMTLGSPPSIEVVPANPSSSRAADAVPGQALHATFRNLAGTLEVNWRSILRDDAGYLRQAIDVRSLSGSHSIASITGLTGTLPSATLSGYTDGSVVTGSGIFAGLETPVAKTTVNVGSSQAIGSWNPTLVTPKRMTFPVTFGQSGIKDILFLYSAGNHRLDITRCELLDGTGQVVSFDQHAGYTGNLASANSYQLNAPAAGSYTLAVDLTYVAGQTNSYGNITWSDPGTKTVRSDWPRNQTLAPGSTWSTSAVIGAYPPGQLRRAFLHYLELERAHPYRQFVHYNSWYDLSISRNENPDPLTRMTEGQTLAVVDAWNTALYTSRGVRLDGFVWDDGWDDFHSLWSFHVGFPRGFAETGRRAHNQQAGIGAWLSPWGGYGSSKSQRVAYWNSTHDPDIGEFHLSNEEYYQVFRGRCFQMLDDYDMRSFKFDGIGAGTFATGPAAGNEADIDGLLRLLVELRGKRRDVFTNCTVGTWASPFWLSYCDSVWRQGEDVAFEGPGNNRDRWVTYHDNMVYDRFVANAPLVPLNGLMPHGITINNYPGTVAAQMPLDLPTVKNEIRCAMACGAGLQELYVTHGLMTSAMWDELAAGIRWVRANADVLSDVHWVGGKPYNPDDGSTAIYGWAAWQPRKATLALRNPSATAKSITFTLAQALELPVDGSFTIKDAYSDQRALAGFTNAALAKDTSITLQLQPFEVLVYDLWPATSLIPTAPLSAAPNTPSSFGMWAAQRAIPMSAQPGQGIDEVFSADHNGNGIPNGVEYAFGGQRPLLASRSDTGIRFDCLPQLPATADSVVAGVEASDDLIDWELPLVPVGSSNDGLHGWQPADPTVTRAFVRIRAALK